MTRQEWVEAQIRDCPPLTARQIAVVRRALTQQPTKASKVRKEPEEEMTTQEAMIVEIERLGFEYEIVPQFDLETLSPDRRVQVRESGHYAPQDEVQRYAVQMEHSQFPPIVVTQDEWIVDGNTRVGAQRQRKVKFGPAIRLKVNYGTGSAKQQNELKALAATLNNLNGRGLTRKEARIAAESLINLGWRTEQIGRALGVSQSVITQVRKEIAAASKLERLDLDKDGIPNVVLRALGARDPLALNDAPYKELASLSSDAGFSDKEVGDLARAMKAAGSDESALEIAQTRRFEFGDRIREHGLTGKRTKLPKAAQLRQSYGFGLKHEDQMQELMEADPNLIPQHIEMTERFIKALSKLLDLQR